MVEPAPWRTTPQPSSVTAAAWIAATLGFFLRAAKTGGYDNPA
jgi:hypothetical protein